MARSDLIRLVPAASEELRRILDADRGPVQPPNRAEIFGPQRFEQHGRSLARAQHAKVAAARSPAFFPRLRDNVRTLREANHYIGTQLRTGYDVSPASEWLLDNFHLIEAQLKEIHEGLPRRYFRDLPVLLDEPLAGLPRIYGVAWAFVAHTDGAFDEELLEHFLVAYQRIHELTLGELWALSTTLRVVLVENLRRLAERLATNKAARELANLVGDRIDDYTDAMLDELLALLNRRGVGPVFLAQIAQRLHDPGAAIESSSHRLEWLGRVVPDLSAVRTQLPVERAADNLSVSNAIGSLRLIGNADWPDIVAHTSATMQALLGSPSFEAERDDTRDQTLHAIESLARRSRRSELTVAQILLELMHGSGPTDPGSPERASSTARHWLRGPGRGALLARLGLSERGAALRRTLLRRAALPAYLGSLALGTAALVAWMLVHHGAALSNTGAMAPWLTGASAMLMLFPASEAVVAMINRLIGEWARPQRLARLALAQGIPPEHRVLVVIPGMLTGAAAVENLTHRLRLHYLANPERHAQFALLTDWADADTATRPDDATLLTAAVERIEALNTRHPVAAGRAPRFIVLHRARQFSATQQRFIGWERKRGKLEQLIAAIAQPAAAPHTPPAFIDLGEASHLEPGAVYVVTLDGDTQLPPGRLRELVGVAAHPNNQPVVDPERRIVTSGYGILQPRVATPLPAPRDMTAYHWLFAGQCGIDPYSAASSEVYQDVFREGTFTGKGLLNVRAMHAVLSERLPDGRVLSHDLLEGSLARCAAVTDVNVIEDAPFHADVAASRVHRWMRGDWQLLPFLFHPKRYAIRAINRWKMLDNLRRSLVAPMSLGLMALVLATGVIDPWATLALIFVAFAAGPLIGAIAGFAPSRDAIAKAHFYRRALADLLRALCGGLWQVAQLLQLALMSLDAVLRALWRMAVSRRGLLEWTTAAAAQATASIDLRVLMRRHWAAPVAAAVLLAALLAGGTPTPRPAVLLCVVWAASAVWIWWVSRPRPIGRDAGLPAPDEAYFHGLARDTWRLFERCVGPDDNHLPPDNLQLTPHSMVAHRTSPTNIGLYLLATACARRFGWIGTEDMVARLEATLATLATLPRHRGHFLNWYDTQSRAALTPMYVSTVDSGNLSGHLLALAQACLELAHSPYDPAAARRAVTASLQRIEPLRRPAETTHLPETALSRLLALADPLARCLEQPESFATLLDDVDDELRARSEPTEPALVNDAGDTAHEGADTPLDWLIADHLATLRSALRDARAEQAARSGSRSRPGAVQQRLRALADTCQRLAWEADFAFLYHRKRRLFHIGYRVAEQQLDGSFYDLLASESRLTSLLAIAKGDAPVSHWSALGRPFYAVGALAGLRSWSGSMFEYLMPSLVLDEPHDSVLRDACKSALREQIRFGRAHDVPWGISESAIAASDHTLAYQYGPQGVPRLALRRTPADELVVAPYATALAAQIAPHRAVANLALLESLAARRRLGFVEALDYTPMRQTDASGLVRVDTFMAHHQGMSIVALANVLLEGAPRRWGMADPHIEAVSSLLHERAPREVSMLLEPPPQPTLVNKERRRTGLTHEVVPGMAALSPTHLLSNGRYSVALRANGAGSSRWDKTRITRTRDDLLRDAQGSFFHLRWDRQPNAVSLTQHPAPDPRAHYQSSYHADRVCFDATWPELASRVTVWVSPEDDIEFRQIELSNLGERALDLEFMSSFEVTLAAPGADEAHPAFSNLFVRAQWRAAHRALVFERAPRLAGEGSVFAAHFLAEGGDDPQLRSLGIQTDRLGWLGRNRDTSRPLASFDAAPAQDAVLDTGLDPVCAMSLRLQLTAHSRVRLTLCTAAGDDPSVLAALVDKYRQRGPIERASLMSATLAGIRLRELRLNAEDLSAIQALTTVLLMTATRAPSAVRPTPTAPLAPAPPSDRRTLWRFGISGDLPIVLVFASLEQDLGMLRSLARALRVWSLGGVACDLVVIDAEPASYLMPLQRGITALRERHIADSAAQPGPAQTSFHVLRMDALSAPELVTLKTLARVRLNADGRPLAHHVQDWLAQHDEALALRDAVSRSTVPVAPGATTRVPQGRFAAHNGEFSFDVNAFQRPARPWVNVIANPEFGTQLSEAGGGYSWAVNSRLNQLTPWSNDPVADPPGEWLLLQDLRTLETWSIAASAWGDGAAVYSVTHGQGYSRIGHRCGDLEVDAVWCVDTHSAVKQLHLKLVNRGRRTLRLRVINLAEWVMGAGRGDRASVDTASFVQGLPAAARHAVSEAAPTTASGRQLTALLCTQRDHAAGFGDGTAFLATVTDTDNMPDWTCDRRECFDARGRIVVPDEFSERSGPGLDPCAALALLITLPAGQSSECVFLLGYGANREAAQQLALAAAAVPPRQRLQDARAAWDKLLGATTVQTPDPLFDALTNRWLLYQTVSCRLWARAGFYQAGGAFGFRDQLQDAMALGWADPQTLREQIVLNASRQFPEGDVQHWWHAPTGAGVRTHFSDDLLWLAYACTHYLNCTEDSGLLDESVPFIEGIAIPEGAEDAYYVPTVSSERASIFEHCARAIDRSLRVGAHGLPLMGTGDWNDGMNRVGHEGRGESVWLAWFLCRVIKDFAPLALARGEAGRAKAWQEAARGWRAALQGPGWDGQWYRRAFFDDGTPLGSQLNPECRIDLIAQAWATLSDAAPVAFRRIALTAMDARLVDTETGLIKLLTPPLQNAQPSAGYIQAYPPGVRENGGQYSHAGVWALMAQARSGNAEAAYRYFTYLSPAHRTQHPAHGPAYGAEPYVMAGDVYSAPPYVGRGGWSWYTGSAGWMHRAAIESIFGMRQRDGAVSFTPCLPPHWDHAELRLVRDERSLRIVFARPDAAQPLADAARSGALALRPGETLRWDSLERENRFLLRLDAATDRSTEAVDVPAVIH